MNPLFKSISLLLPLFSALLLSACAQTKATLETSAPSKETSDQTQETSAQPQETGVQTLAFEPGMKALADNIVAQLEKSRVGHTKVRVDPVTKQSQLIEIVIDPFFDTNSGYPVKINARINTILSGAIAKRFAVTGEMVPENLKRSEYVLTGMVSLGETEQGQPRHYQVHAVVFEKSSGIVHAASEVRIVNFDTTPMDIYQDSPMYLKGKNYQAHVSSVQKKPSETVAKEYHDTLSGRSIRVKGDALYEAKDYDQSLAYYNQAAVSEGAGHDLETLNGLFTNLIHQGFLDEAEPVYWKLLRVSVGETRGIASKITFGPNSKAPVAGKADIYNIYIKQIAHLVGAHANCRVKIVGHCSKTGSEAYNDKLSLQRALHIQKQMASFYPHLIERSEVLGRGFRDNIVGTGADDVTDEIDRRVEFKFSSCGH